MEQRRFTFKWMTLCFFVLSNISPYSSLARASRKIQSSSQNQARANVQLKEQTNAPSRDQARTSQTTSKARANSKANTNIKTKRNSDLDGSGVQNQVSPDGNGATVTTVVGGLTTGTALTSTGSPAVATTTASVGVAIPTAGRAAGDAGGVVLLGYTPTPPPTPTPSQAANTGMQIAAGLAGALASMFGGGGGNNKQADNSRGNSGGGGGGNQTINSEPANPGAGSSNQGGGEDSSSTVGQSGPEPIIGSDKPSPTLPPKEDRPGNEQEGTSPKQDTPTTPPKDLSSQCKVAPNGPDRWLPNDTDFYLPQDPKDMIVVLCDQQKQKTPSKTDMTAAQAMEFTPLVAPRPSGDSKKPLQVTTLLNKKSSPIYPVARGTILGGIKCDAVPNSSKKSCFFRIEHPKCPRGDKSPCISAYRNILVDKGSEPTEGQEVLPCKKMGMTSDEIPGFNNLPDTMWNRLARQFPSIIGTSTPDAPKASSEIYMTAGPDGAGEPIVPFTGFKDWETAVKTSQQHSINKEPSKQCDPARQILEQKSAQTFKGNPANKGNDLRVHPITPAVK